MRQSTAEFRMALLSPQCHMCPMDITDAASVEKAITEVDADAVVHCAAWTAVDAAEDEDKTGNGPCE